MDIIKAIITRIDTTSNWTTLNPVPANGEQCIEVLGKGLFKLKVGDGVTPWLALRYETLDDGYSKFKVLLEKEIRERKAADNELWIALTDGLAQKIDHFEELPEITEENVGNVVQYIGKTTGEYIENYFYKSYYDYHDSVLLIDSSDPDIHPYIDKEIFEQNTHFTKDTTLKFRYVEKEESGDESGGEIISYWTLNGKEVDLYFYGIALDQLPENGTILTVTYKIADIRYYWERVNVQPETDLGPVWEAIEELDHKVDEKVEELNQTIQNVEETLDNKKVDKTHEGLKIYGTDKDGNQKLYDKEDFGKVDDVRLNGTSVVVDKIANIEPEANDVAYTNEQYPEMQTLQDAMDKLLYIDPKVTKFTGSLNKEKGENVSVVNFTWDYNKKMVSQSINQGIGNIDIALKAYNYVPATPITSNISFTLTANDGTKDCTSSQPVSIRFYSAYYYGTSAKASLTNEEILQLTKNTTYTSIKRKYTFSSKPVKVYAYFVFPTSECSGISFSEGFDTSDYIMEQRNITSTLGVTQQYNIYRFHSDSPYDAGASIEITVK